MASLIPVLKKLKETPDFNWLTLYSNEKSIETVNNKELYHRIKDYLAFYQDNNVKENDTKS